MDIPFTIRPFCAADQSAARQLVLEGLGEHFGFIDETLNPDVDNIEACYSLAGHRFVVAELNTVNTINTINTMLIGTGALMVYPDGIGQLVRVSVVPQYRRRGVASAILQHLLQTASSLKLTRVIVETTKGWADAAGLYEALGFTLYDEDDEHIYMEMTLVST